MKHLSQAEEIEEIRQLVRKSGLRSTAARITVIQFLRKAKSPLTHAEIAEDLTPMGFDKATVYRNLIDLADAGLVKRTELGDHAWRFELRNPDEPEDAEHPHFVCTECGSVSCLHDVDFKTPKNKQWAAVGRVTEILLKGVCSECDEEE